MRKHLGLNLEAGNRINRPTLVELVSVSSSKLTFLQPVEQSHCWKQTVLPRRHGHVFPIQVIVEDLSAVLAPSPLATVYRLQHSLQPAVQSSQVCF